MRLRNWYLALLFTAAGLFILAMLFSGGSLDFSEIDFSDPSDLLFVLGWTVIISPVLLVPWGVTRSESRHDPKS